MEGKYSIELFDNIDSSTDEWETQIEFSQDDDGTIKLASKIVIAGYKARKFSSMKIWLESQKEMMKLSRAGGSCSSPQMDQI